MIQVRRGHFKGRLSSSVSQVNSSQPQSSNLDYTTQDPNVNKRMAIYMALSLVMTNVFCGNPQSVELRERRSRPMSLTHIKHPRILENCCVRLPGAAHGRP